VALTLLCACRNSPAGSAPPASQPEPPPSFVGKLWTSTDPSAALGTVRAFLSDGTMVIDSCFETYRLARWRTLDEKRIEWSEDGARIEAEIARLTADELGLRLRLVSEVKEENYRLARAPFVCPDLPR
jgi:hypothetical protein